MSSVTSQSAAGINALMQYSSGMRCIFAWLLRAILSVLALSSRQLAKLLGMYLGGRSLCWCTMMDQTQHAQHGQHDLRTGCPYCKLLSGVEGRKHIAIGFLPTDSNAIGNAGFLRQLERSKTTWRHSNSNSCLETSRHASQMPDTLQLLSSAY